MGVTPNGLPYPEPTDDVANGADNIRALAEAVVARAGDTMTGALAAPGLTSSGNVRSGNDPVTPGVTGAQMVPSGKISSQVTVSNAWENINMNRGGDAIGVGAAYVRLNRLGTQIGSIAIASANSVAYNTTSDQRLKDRTGDVDDAAELVQALGRLAYRGRWITDEAEGTGDEWVFLNSQDVQPVAPFAVMGEPDGVNEDGNIEPQQLDHGALVPLLTAALSQALDRITALEEALA